MTSSKFLSLENKNENFRIFILNFTRLFVILQRKNETMNYHYIINCVAGFSFLMSAGFMSMVHVPYAAVWDRLRRCRLYLSLIFLIVGISCCKTIIFNLDANADNIVTSTLISASVQSLLFACTGITFVNPEFIGKKWVMRNLVVIIANAIFLLVGRTLCSDYFLVFAIVAAFVYLALWTSYQFVFYKQYHLCVEKADLLTDEYSESRFRWIRDFFVAVSGLGFTAAIVPFFPVYIYDSWMLLAAGFYVYVMLSFTNYICKNANLVNKIYAQRQTTCSDISIGEELPHEEPSSEASTIDQNIQRWIENKGFVDNDLMSEDIARNMGMSIAVFRAYFRNKYDMDFRQWRTKCRIEYACTIMKEHPDYSYDAIAEMIGICDRSNFLKTFKKIKGCTPKEYMEKLPND